MKQELHLPFRLIKLCIYVAAGLQAIRIYLDKVSFWGIWVLGLLLFLLLLPMGRKKTPGKPLIILSYLLFDGILSSLGMYYLPNPGSLQFLFFTLLALTGQLPFYLSMPMNLVLLCLNYLPYLLRGKLFLDMGIFFDMFPGQIIFIIFSTIFWKYRILLEENKKIFRELVQTKSQLEPLFEITGQPISFSRREKEILELLAKGYTNKEIAERLYLAEGTVKNRVSLLLGKTGVKNRTQVALWISQKGLL